MRLNLGGILSGQTATRSELIAAGVFVMVWFGMDVIQFVDWIGSAKCAP